LQGKITSLYKVIASLIKTLKVPSSYLRALDIRVVGSCLYPKLPKALTQKLLRGVIEIKQFVKVKKDKTTT
jgi:hypothetical protein